MRALFFSLMAVTVFGAPEASAVPLPYWESPAEEGEGAFDAGGAVAAEGHLLGVDEAARWIMALMWVGVSSAITLALLRAFFSARPHIKQFLRRTRRSKPSKRRTVRTPRESVRRYELNDDGELVCVNEVDI